MAQKENYCNPTRRLYSVLNVLERFNCCRAVFAKVECHKLLLITSCYD